MKQVFVAVSVAALSTSSPSLQAQEPPAGCARVEVLDCPAASQLLQEHFELVCISSADSVSTTSELPDREGVLVENANGEPPSEENDVAERVAGEGVDGQSVDGEPREEDDVAEREVGQSVEGQSVGGEPARVHVRVLAGTCDAPERIEWRVADERIEWPVRERTARWRFIALAISEVLRTAQDAASSSDTALADASTLPPSAQVSNDPEPTQPWVDPRPLATAADITRWKPTRSLEDIPDVGRGATAIRLQLGASGSGGFVGTGALQIRHRFESPWTLGAELRPAIFARRDGQSLGQLIGGLRGGYDGRAVAAELALGLAPSRSAFRPASPAPTAGLRIRVGIEDMIALRMAAEIMVAAESVKLHRLLLRFHATIFERWRVGSHLEGFFANGIYSALLSVRYWAIGTGDAGSFSIGGQFGARAVLYERQCEFGDCSAVGGATEAFVGPTLQLDFEVRL